MVNIIKLRETMAARSISYEDAARAIGVDRATIYRRMERAGAKFTVEEVGKLSKLLGLDAKTMQDIFFEQELA